MKFVTMVYYTEEGRHKVLPKQNLGDDSRTAALFTLGIESDFKSSANKDKIKNIRARTFELEVPSFDVSA